MRNWYKLQFGVAFFSCAVKKFHDLCPNDGEHGKPFGRGRRKGGHLYTEVLQEFLGFQFLVDMVLDELRENGLALLKRLARELQPADLG